MYTFVWFCTFRKRILTDFLGLKRMQSRHIIEEHCIRVRNLAELQDMLCDVMELTNSYYGFQARPNEFLICLQLFKSLTLQIVMYLGSCFAFMVLTFFCCYRLAVSQSKENVILSMVMLAWVNYDSFLLLIIIAVASNLKKKVRIIYYYDNRIHLYV